MKKLLKELQSSIGFYEVQTGQSIGNVICTQLPASLSWLGTTMAGALTQSGFSQGLAHFMTGVPGGRWSFLAISIVVFTVLGSVLEGIPAMVLLGPLLFPIAKQIGINELHYAVVVILAMGIGLFAPPFGLGYYAACIVGRVPPERGLRRIWPYLGALTAGIVVIALVPWLSTGFIPAP